MKKKAQTSLEFLMTYGWAILIVIVIVVVAWQWGFFNPSGAVKKGSSGFWGVSPLDFSYMENGNLELSLKNGVGGGINITEVEVRGGTVIYSDTNPGTRMSGGAGISPGSQSIYSLPSSGESELPGGGIGSSYDLFLSIEYNDSRTLEVYRSSGKIWGSIEGV